MERILLAFCLLFTSAFGLARDPLSDEEVAQIIDQFQYPGNYTELYSYKDGGPWSSCWHYEKQLTSESPMLFETIEANVRLYIPNRRDLGDDQVPMVIMIPPVGGTNFLDRQMAETFCASDIAAVILTDDFGGIEEQTSGNLRPVEDHQITLHRVVGAIKAAIALGNDDPNIDSSKVGLFGVSLGGILSSFAMTTLPEISAGYFVVAGGDLPNILAYSEQEKIRRIRGHRMREQSFNDQAEYEEWLRIHLTYDPIDLARTMLPETIQMVIAERDDAVPTTNQLALFEAFGEPEATFLPIGHVDAVIETLLFGSERRRIAEFFDDRFKLANPRGPQFSFLRQFPLEQYY